MVGMYMNKQITLNRQSHSLFNDRGIRIDGVVDMISPSGLYVKCVKNRIDIVVNWDHIMGYHYKWGQSSNYDWL